MTTQSTIIKMVRMELVSDPDLLFNRSTLSLFTFVLNCNPIFIQPTRFKNKGSTSERMWITQHILYKIVTLDLGYL